MGREGCLGETVFAFDFGLREGLEPWHTVEPELTGGIG